MSPGAPRGSIYGTENGLAVLVGGAGVIQFDGEVDLLLSEAVAVDGDT